MRIESVHDLHTQFPDIAGNWIADDLAATETKLRSLLPTQIEEEWNSNQLQSLLQLVRVLSLQGKESEAKESLELARRKVALLPPEQFQMKIRLMLEEGRHLCIGMTPVKAQPYFQQAWTLATEKGDVYLAIESAVMLSVSQPPKFQNEWLQKAIGLAEKTDLEVAKLWLAQLYLMSGWHAFDFRRTEEALKYFNLALARPRDPGEMTDVIRIRWCIARCLRALNRVQEALDIQMELLSEVTRLGKVNGHVFLEIAECLQAQQKQDEAKSYFESAYKELSNNGWYSDNKAPELSRMQELYKKRY